MTLAFSAMNGVPVALQSAATTGNGKAIAIPNTFDRHQVSIKGSAGISAGAVQIETADSFDYTGTWTPVSGGPITAVANEEIVVNFNGLYRAIRARISTDIVGGTIDVNYTGAKYD